MKTTAELREQFKVTPIDKNIPRPCPSCYKKSSLTRGPELLAKLEERVGKKIIFPEVKVTHFEHNCPGNTIPQHIDPNRKPIPKITLKVPKDTKKTSNVVNVSKISLKGPGAVNNPQVPIAHKEENVPKKTCVRNAENPGLVAKLPVDAMPSTSFKIPSTIIDEKEKSGTQNIGIKGKPKEKPPSQKALAQIALAEQVTTAKCTRARIMNAKPPPVAKLLQQIHANRAAGTSKPSPSDAPKIQSDTPKPIENSNGMPASAPLLTPTISPNSKKVQERKPLHEIKFKTNFK